jgi:large subunit ribosomal protein L40
LATGTDFVSPASIRYFLHHPRTPRPLRFSRTRYLRHWTIHRAWHRYQDVLREKRERELERQYNAMAAACEHLRLMDANGLTDQDRRNIAALSQPPREEGRLYRIAMLKNGIWKGVPIEYARMQTETPARDGWNHSWTR